MAVHEHELSRRANDGSRDDIRDNGYDEQRYWSRDQRSETRTTFYQSDIDDLDVSERRKRQLRRALRWQEGEGKPNRASRNYEEDKRRMVEAIAGQLGMTRRQKDRIKHLILDVISVNSFGSYTMEQAILATVNVVAREDDRWIEDEEVFREYMEHVEIDDLNTMRRLRAMVRDRIPSKP